MKIFTNKNLIQKVIIVFLCVFLLNFCMAPSVQASFGGSLFSPMKKFITVVADIFITLVQWGITGNWISAVDNSTGAVVLDNSSVWDNGLIGLRKFEYPVIQISPELIFSNQIRLLDIDFIGNQNEDQYSIDSGNKIVIGDGEVVTALRSIIASWYVTLRTISIVGLLSVLLYIGIRIMIASTSADKAKYKQMILDWIIAFCLLLFMHYIMAGMIRIVDRVDDLLAKAANIGTGISLNEEYGNVSYGGHNDRLSGTNFRISDIKELLQGYGVELREANNPITQDDSSNAGVWKKWYFYDTQDELVLRIDQDSEIYSVRKIADSIAEYKDTIEQSLRAPASTTIPDTTGGTQSGSGEASQTITESGDTVYVSSDPSKVLYYINYARLYVNLDDPGESFGFIILYVILIVFTTMFAVRYMKRVIYIAFLTLIAPLVALTYPIDKIKDGQAQAFNMWFREYIFNVMIQPFHLLIYTILVGSAMTLASEHMIYAIVAIGFLIPAEKLLRKFFGFDKAGTLSAAGSFAGGAIFSSILNKINRPKPGGKGGSGSDKGKSSGVRKPGNIEMNPRDILFNRMSDQGSANGGSGEGSPASEDSEMGRTGNSSERSYEQSQDEIEPREIEGLTDSVFENTSRWELAKKGLANRISNTAYSGYYRAKTKLADKARTLPKAGGRLIRKAAIGGLVGGGLGTIGLAVGAASGDPSKAFSLAAAGGAAGYYGANYYGDKLAKAAGNMAKSSEVAFWGTDIKAIEQARFDRDFYRNPDNRDKLIRALNSPGAVQEAIDNGQVQAFLNVGITDAGKIGKSLLLLNKGKVKSLQEAVAVAQWNRDLGPAIFDPSSEHRANYIKRTIKEMKSKSSDPNNFNESVARARIVEVLDNINYLNI